MIDLAPGYKNVYVSLGKAYKKLKQRRKAIAAFDEELRYDRDNFFAYAELGWIYKELKDYPKALENFRKALTYPSLPNAEEIGRMISSIETDQKQ